MPMESAQESAIHQILMDPTNQFLQVRVDLPTESCLVQVRVKDQGQELTWMIDQNAAAMLQGVLTKLLARVSTPPSGA